MQGRFHLYEGWDPKACTIPIRVMKLFGVEKIILTNAAGGVNPNVRQIVLDNSLILISKLLFKFKLGDFMIIKDHLFLPGLCGFNPLVGKNDSEFGPRFPPMGDAYNLDLQASAKQSKSMRHSLSA